jgi:hypothetical protein
LLKFDDIISFSNKYDIGLFYLEPVTFNYENALPNKLFEFIQARLAIAISPNPEMKAIVDKYNLGVVADNYSIENLAEKIKKLSRQDILAFKHKAHQCAALETAEHYHTIYYNTMMQMHKDLSLQTSNL